MPDLSRASARHTTRHPRVVMRRRTWAEGAVIMGLVATMALGPVLQAQGHPIGTPLPEPQDTIIAGGIADEASVDRDGFTASPSQVALINEGTNEAWAKLVLLFGGWERTEPNVTVIMRWMRQENYIDNWWNSRNNPLNNGWGTTNNPGGGLGTYTDLVDAARNAADALHSNPGYSEIVDGFEAGDDADATAYAIWWSPWSTSHYHNGDHWSTAPYDVVKAPDAAWGK